MRKLKIIEHISLDGVIQHSADDDDFPYGDWTAPYRTPAGLDATLAAQGESFDLLLGRCTYDLWSGFWAKAPSSPMADRLNAATKFIAYDGLMIFGTPDRPAFPGWDAWCDIRSATSNGHWIPAGGEPSVVSTSLATETPGAMSRTSMSWLPASPPGNQHPDIGVTSRSRLPRGGHRSAPWHRGSGC
ncbi:MAG: hypothetical protein WB611_16140, partial [Stellaceae bacterium]